MNTDSTGKDVLEVFENRTINRESLGQLKVVVTGWLLTNLLGRLLPPSLKTLMGEMVKNGMQSLDYLLILYESVRN